MTKCKACGGRTWVLVKKLRPVKGPRRPQQTDIRLPCPKCSGVKLLPIPKHAIRRLP